MVGFWFFMLVMALLTPISMMILGNRFLKCPPNEISTAFGYRTVRSMQNRETWAFAQRCFGKWCKRCSALLLPISVCMMLTVWGKRIAEMGMMAVIVIIAQVIILLLVTLLPTERALKKNFDACGRRR